MSQVVKKENSAYRYSEYFHLIKDEFKEIPWLNEKTFNQGSLFLLLDDEKIVGGLSLFETSPEPEQIKEEAAKYIHKQSVFISCFSITEQYRGKDYGKLFLKKVLSDEVFAKDKECWGIFQKEWLIGYYQKYFNVSIHNLSNGLRLVIFKN